MQAKSDMPKRYQLTRCKPGCSLDGLPRTLLLGLAPETVPARPLTVVPVGVEGRINVDQVDAAVGQLGELFQIVAAIIQPHRLK